MKKPCALHEKSWVGKSSAGFNPGKLTSKMCIYGSSLNLPFEVLESFLCQKTAAPCIARFVFSFEPRINLY